MSLPSASATDGSARARGRRGGDSRLTELAEIFTGHRDRLVALSILIGIGAGLGAIAFRAMIVGLTELFTGHANFGVDGATANPHLPWLGIAFVVIVPVIGGLLYGPLVARLAPEAKGHGVPEVMLAVAEHQGRMRARVPVVKALASALCIGAGGSVGREGPITQIGSAIGSVAGQLAKVPPQKLRLLVACGAAGGIAATFNAPIAGVFFAMELILRDFEASSFGIIVLSSVTATAIGRIAFGSGAFLSLPSFHVTSAVEYPLYAVLGLIAAIAAISFVRVLYGAEDVADRIWHGRPEWLRPAVGGVLLGLLLLALPQMYGVGYPVLHHAIAGRYVVGLLVLLVAGKIAATSLTMAIGGSGGVFAPSLFIGAALGTAFGVGAHSLLPSLTGPPGAYGLVGMAAVFAAAAGAPITAVIIVFELTGDYSIILPLMIGVAAAAGLGRALSDSTIYTRKLLRRGIDIDAPKSDPLLRRLRVADAMRPLPAPVDPGTSITDLVHRFAENGGSYPVLNGEGVLLGLVDADDIEQAALEADPRSIGRLAHTAPELNVADSLEVAIKALAESEGSALPVLDEAGSAPVGWLGHSDIVRAYARALRDAETRAPQPGGVGH